MRFLPVVLAVTAALWGVFPAMAVDGYKSLKFGMSMKQVANEKMCSFRVIKDDEEEPYLECHDFSFGKTKTEAYAYFIDGKFMRLAIALPDYQAVDTVIAGLSEKYGQPSSSSTDQEFAAIEQTPNAQVYMSFDNDMVYVLQESDEDRVQSALLIYTHSDFDALRDAKAKADVSSDL